jgi:hypothetical protein
MNIEVQNITYDLTSFVDLEPPAHPLPTTATVDIDPDDDVVTSTVKELESATGWLVTGFDYRAPGGQWTRHDEDMTWHKALCDALSENRLPTHEEMFGR